MKKKTYKPIPERTTHTEEARLKRVDFIEKILNRPIPNIKNSRIPADTMEGNIENYIGSVEIPIAIAGPLQITGKHAEGQFYLPVATTEGALVSSITRGSIALTKAGCLTALALEQKMIRAPVFSMHGVKEALQLSNWVKQNIRSIKDVVSSNSHHAKLICIEPKVMGRRLHLRFVYSTGDASGQNMTTKCTWECCQWILSAFETEHPGVIQSFFIDGNMSSDKKASYLSSQQGRGVHVVAEVRIPGKVLKRVLLTSQAQILEAYNNIAASAQQAGMISMNLNIANVIAGVFVATGQDIACVHESSLGNLFIEPWEDGIYCSMTLSNLVIGTVGGGTALRHQKEALTMLDCYGKNRVMKFAEIICGFCLALEVSTLSAIAGGQFVEAHESLGRNRP